MSASPGSDHLAPLTSIRFLAGVPIVLFHATIMPPIDLERGWLQGFINTLAVAGVTFFFILSGFLLGRRYGEKILNRTTSIRDYLVLRLARIYPLYIAGLLVGAFSFRNREWTYEQLFFAVTMMQSWVPDPKYFTAINPPSWSISVEIFFYLAFIGLVRLPSAVLVVLCLVFYGASCLIQQSNVLPFEIEMWLVYFSPLGRIPDFALGLLLHRFHLHKDAKERAEPFDPGRRTLVEAGTVILWLGSCFVVGAFINAGAHISKGWYYNVPATCLLVYVFSLGGGAVSKAISHPVLVFLGYASYAMYLVHVIIVFRMSYLFEDLGLDMPVLFGVLCVSLSIASSAVIYRYFEEPVRVRLIAYLQRTRRLPPPPLRKAA